MLVTCPACERPVEAGSALVAGGDAIRVSKWIACTICKVHLNVSSYRTSKDHQVNAWSRWYVLSWRDRAGHWHHGPEHTAFFDAQKETSHA
jgi:hypothetical protein